MLAGIAGWLDPGITPHLRHNALRHVFNTPTPLMNHSEVVGDHVLETHLRSMALVLIARWDRPFGADSCGRQGRERATVWRCRRIKPWDRLPEGSDAPAEDTLLLPTLSPSPPGGLKTTTSRTRYTGRYLDSPLGHSTSLRVSRSTKPSAFLEEGEASQTVILRVRAGVSRFHAKPNVDRANNAVLPLPDNEVRLWTLFPRK